jgi:hypothetical protein
VDEDEWLERHGLHPDEAGLDEVRALLAEQTRLERASQGNSDTILMRLCCVQLFLAGELDDLLLIWRAMSASFDAHCSIDVQLLCGGGLEETRAHLAAHGSAEAESALKRLLHCEEAGDFDDFSPSRRSAEYAAYYG